MIVEGKLIGVMDTPGNTRKGVLQVVVIISPKLKRKKDQAAMMRGIRKRAEEYQALMNAKKIRITYEIIEEAKP